MEALGVTASIIAVVQLTTTCIKFCKPYLGPSHHNHTNLKQISSKLIRLNGTLKNLQLLYEIHEEDQARLDAFNHLREPLNRCKEALDTIQNRLEKHSFMGQYVVGARFDGQLKQCLKAIDEGKDLFDLALDADQIILTKAVECYIRNVTKDVGNLQESMNENGKRVSGLESLAKEQFEQARRFHGDTMTGIQAVEENVSAQIATTRRWHKDEKSTKILAWLSPVDHLASHQEALNSHCPRTGEWLLQSRSFQSWLCGDSGFLWLHGIAGAGKTLLLSTAIMHSQKYCLKNNYGFAFFYCDFRNLETLNPVHLFGSLIQQLVVQLPQLPECVEDLYDGIPDRRKPDERIPDRRKPDRRKPSLKNLLVVLSKLYTTYFDRIYVIIDGLDECTDRRILLDALTELSNQHIRQFRLLISSRKHNDISHAFAGKHAIMIQKEDIVGDITSYVKYEIERNDVWKRLAGNVKSDVIDALVNGADGMFQWVKCQLDTLRELRTVRAILDALRTLPGGLSEAYARMLSNIRDADKELARKAFIWLVYSKRPLKLAELGEAVGVGLADRILDLNSRLLDATAISEICGGLVTISETTTPMVSLAHYSIREFFVSAATLSSDSLATQYATDEARAHAHIARTCLSYVSFGNFSSGPCNYRPDFEQRLVEYPLYKYAAECWNYHAKKSNLQAEGHWYKVLFSQPKTAAFMSLVEVLHDPLCEGYYETNTKPIHLAAEFGVESVVRQLLIDGADPNEPGGSYLRPLLAAIKKENPTIVDILIDAGAKRDSIDDTSDSALRLAASCLKSEVVERIICDGTKINIGPREGGALLTAVAARNHIVAELLIKYGADINQIQFMRSPCVRQRPLDMAIRRRDEGMVRLLLSHSVDLSDNGYLSLAARLGGFKILQMLFNSGCDMDKLGRDALHDALHDAARKGHVDIFKYLLERVDLHPCIDGCTHLLKSAACGGSTNLVRFVLDRHKSSHSHNLQFGSALSNAFESGNIMTVQMLLDAGAEINDPDNEFERALEVAARDGSQEMLQLLLRSGIDANTQCSYRYPPLMRAANSGHESCIKLLLDAGADANVRNDTCSYSSLESNPWNKEDHIMYFSSQTVDMRALKRKMDSPLIFAAEKGHRACVELLLGARADINATNSEGGTPLTQAAKNGHMACVNRLLSLGAGINASERSLGCALRAAAGEGDEDAVGALLKSGADVNAPGSHGGSPLARAAISGKRRVVQLLLDHGAEVNAPVCGLGCALCLASGNGEVEIVRLILERGGKVENCKALAEAVSYGCEETVQLLIDAGAKWRWNLLEVAAARGRVRCASMLLKKRANIPERYLEHALRAASLRGSIQLVRMLLERGADVKKSGQTKTHNGEDYRCTALEAAVAMGHGDVIALLEDAGA